VRADMGSRNRPQDKHKKKQADLNSLKQWRSDRKHNRGDIGNEEALNAGAPPPPPRHTVMTARCDCDRDGS
jgi:hypothetical protein